ncbi:hypothetical protein [Nitratidesulfovibrio sp. 1201_IL3209]|uniref:hypothetical protein n=1 Tax=Nitratidesulfovibrio sp. 1201_IL3209 TaxID=3084053 RepID=UPI002FD9D4CD
MNDDRHDIGKARGGSEEPVDCAPGGVGDAAPPAPPTRDEVRRFRLAALRARLALLGVAFDPSTDEATLRRMLRAAEGQGGTAGTPGSSGSLGSPGSSGSLGSPGQPAPAASAEAAEPTNPAGSTEPAVPPSAAMRRATARHLRERQRVAAEDTGVAGVTGVAGSRNGRPRGRGRS